MGPEEGDKEFEAAFDEVVAAVEKEGQKPAGEAAPVVEDSATKVAAAEAAAKTAEAQAAASAKAATDEATKKAAEEKAAQDAVAAKAEETRRAALTEEQRTAEDKTRQEATAAKVQQEAEQKVRQEAELRVKAETDAKAKVEADAKATAEAKTREDAARKSVEDLLKPYEYTPEEQKAMETFKKEFPTEYAAMEARLKAAEKASQAHAHKVAEAILTQVQQLVAPLADGYSADSLERHVTALTSAHPDHATLVDLIPAWIKQQPAYLQKGYQDVYDSGGTKDVIDLFARFKESTGRSKPVVDAAAQKAEAERKAAEAAVAKAAARPSKDDIDSGQPVSARRTGPNTRGAPDPNDYDGAFAEAAKL